MNETLVINNVDLSKLEHRRKVLRNLVLRMMKEDFTNLEEDRALCGVLNMLDDWSDTRLNRKESRPTPFTVLLLYPDYLAEEYGRDTYSAFVVARDQNDAIKKAQQQAAKNYAQYSSGDPWGVVNDVEDFAPLFVCEGHIQNFCMM